MTIWRMSEQPSAGIAELLIATVSWLAALSFIAAIIADTFR